MAFLYIASFTDAKEVAVTPPDFKQRVTFTAAEAESDVIHASERRHVRLLADTDCQIEIGEAPDVTADSIPLIANQPEYFGITPGHRIAVRTPL